MRCLENHDLSRICAFVKEEKALRNFTAFLYFLKGSTMLYGGQEFCCDHTPSLFEKEVFPRNGRDISELLKKLGEIKKTALSCEDSFWGEAQDETHTAVLLREDEKSKKLGVFSLRGEAVEVTVDFPDGAYTNLISGVTVEVKQGKLCCNGEPVILSAPV